MIYRGSRWDYQELQKQGLPPYQFRGHRARPCFQTGSLAPSRTHLAVGLRSAAQSCRQSQRDRAKSQGLRRQKRRRTKAAARNFDWELSTEKNWSQSPRPSPSESRENPRSQGRDPRDQSEDHQDQGLGCQRVAQRAERLQTAQHQCSCIASARRQQRARERGAAGCC